MALIRMILAVAAGAWLAGCGTTHATIETSRGEQLMLLGYDPVAYFTEGKPVRGKHTITAQTEGRTYYFSSPKNRETFAQSPEKFEPQYGGFCSNGAPYGVKLGSDPTEFEIRDGRLFIFGDILGHEFWLLDWRRNIERADLLWPKIRDKGWRSASLAAWTYDKVPWYRTGRSLMEEWEAKHPGRKLEFDTGGTLNNLVFKNAGWRAREGFGQKRLGIPGEADDTGAP